MRFPEVGIHCCNEDLQSIVLSRNRRSECSGLAELSDDISGHSITRYVTGGASGAEITASAAKRGD